MDLDALREAPVEAMAKAIAAERPSSDNCDPDDPCSYCHHLARQALAALLSPPVSIEGEPSMKLCNCDTHFADLPSPSSPISDRREALASLIASVLRAVLDSEEAWWCETHGEVVNPLRMRTPTTKPAACTEDSVADCSMEPVLVVRVRLLAEEGT